MASISPRNPGAEAADDVHRDGRPWAGQVPCLLEGGETLTQRLTVHHGDGTSAMFARLAPSLSRTVARLRSACLACSATVGRTM